MVKIPKKYSNIPGMFIVKDEPKEVTDIRAKILDSFKDLIFIEGPHIYTLYDKQLPSITTVIGQFEKEFDSDSAAERYAIKNGETKEYWLDQWKYKNLRATTTGTLVHEYGESMAYVLNGHPELITESCKSKYYPEKNWLIPTRGKELAIKKFWDDMPASYHFVLAETKVFTNINDMKTKKEDEIKNQMAGTFDLLIYYDGEGNKDKAGLIIFDYKNNGSLYSDYNQKFNVTLLPPFDDTFIAEPKSVYTLQLSAYQIPLEDIGLKVIGRRLIWVKDDETYEKIPVIDVSKRIRKHFNY